KDERTAISEQCAGERQPDSAAKQRDVEDRRADEDLNDTQRQKDTNRCLNRDDAMQQEYKTLHRQIRNRAPMNVVVLRYAFCPITEQDVLPGNVIGQVVEWDRLEQEKRSDQDQRERAVDGKIAACD